jgi:hypothetical protein
LKDLADRHFPHVKTIVLVQDNLNIHSKASLYEAFPASEARRLRDEGHCLVAPAVPISKRHFHPGRSSMRSPSMSGLPSPLRKVEPVCYRLRRM